MDNNISVKTFKKIDNDGALKRLFNLTTRYFNQFIVLRDLELINGKITGYCISCRKKYEPNFYSDGSIMDGSKWHAGHYWKADRHKSVRFHEWNVNLQCYTCNRMLSGNEAKYQGHLIEKIGEDNFSELNILRNQIKHFGYLELEELKNLYNKKRKIEAARLKIKIT